MDTALLESFVTVAEELHFGRASRRLHLTQPALSKQIARLEEYLGAVLLDRSRRHVELTPAGTALVAHARALLARLERAREDVRKAAIPHPRVVIGFVASTPDTLLAPAVRRLQAAHPETEVSLRRMTEQAQIDALAEGLLDVGFVRTPAEIPPPIEARTLVEDPFRLALPHDDPLARRRVIPLRALRGRPLVLFPRASNPRIYDALLDLIPGARVVTEIPEFSRMLPFVAGGGGLAFVPASVPIPKGVVIRDTRPSPPSSAIAVAWNGAARSVQVRGLVASLAPGPTSGPGAGTRRSDGESRAGRGRR